MTDKRNIVIKVSYPVAGKAAENIAPKMITEWNVKRILIAAGVLVLALVALIYGISNDTGKTGVDDVEVSLNELEKPVVAPVGTKETEIKNLDIPKQVVAKTGPLGESKSEINKKQSSIQVNGIIKKQPKEKVIKEGEYSKTNPNVSRALLTYAINNKEPSGEVVRAVGVSLKRPVWLYYFTELKSMNNSKVYHEWLKNGEIISRQELVISDDIWRTSSRKLLSFSEKGNWVVRLVDKNGQLLNEKKFKVE